MQDGTKISSRLLKYTMKLSYDTPCLRFNQILCASNHRALKNNNFSFGYFAANNENCVNGLVGSFIQLARLQAKCIFRANFKM